MHKPRTYTPGVGGDGDGHGSSSGTREMNDQRMLWSSQKRSEQVGRARQRVDLEYFCEGNNHREILTGTLNVPLVCLLVNISASIGI